jgi:hypothetical protein
MIATYSQISSVANFDLSELNFLDADFAAVEAASHRSSELVPYESASRTGDAGPAEANTQTWHMKCECLSERHVFDLLDHVYSLHQESTEGTRPKARFGNDSKDRLEPKTPILIYVTDYQEAVEIDRCLSAVKLRTHLASPFSNWTSVLGKLGTGQLDVIISTTAEIPHADQIPWRAIYLPSALHLAMLTTPQMDWLGNLWFANHIQETPPRLIIRRTKSLA